MCAILDANVAHEVFGSDRPEAGEMFFRWINTGSGRLAIGGRLREELNHSSDEFRRWVRRAENYGRLMVANDKAVNGVAEKLQTEQGLASNDPHILALAQVSRARLLYSNDGDLQADFGTKSLIDNPRGKVYSTREYRDFRDSHRNLLSRKDLCRISP